MDFCKRFEYGDPTLYVFYIHGWLLPHIAQLRAQNKLEMHNRLEFEERQFLPEKISKAKEGTYHGEVY